VQVRHAVGQLARLLLELLERLVVGLVVVLDDLERPPAGKHVAAHEFALEALGQLGVPCPLQPLDGLADLEVGRPGELMERVQVPAGDLDRKSTRLNSSHVKTSYAVFCLKKKKVSGDVT